jgi:hypothetical protein
MTLCEKPLEHHSRTEQQAAVVIQAISRGLAVRKAPEADLAPAADPPLENITMTAAEWTVKHSAELLQRVRHAAELRWKAVDGLHQQQQAQREEEARVMLAAHKKRKEKAAAKAAKRAKGNAGGKGVSDETAPLPEPKAVLLPSDDQFATLRPLAALPPLLLNFLRANLLTIHMHLSGARGGTGGGADGTGGGDAAAGVNADGTLSVEAFKACLRDLGFQSALHDPTDDLDAMIISLCRALGGGRHLPMASLHQYLLAASPELHRTDLQRISMYEPALFEEQLPSPPKAGGKGASKGGTNGSSKGGAVAASAPDAAAANAAKEQLALKQAHPERILLVRVVVIAEDLCTTTYTLEVRVAPPLCIPPLPDSLRPLMAHIVRYHGVTVQVKRAFGQSAVPGKSIEPTEAPSRASPSRRAPNVLSQSRTYGQEARTLLHKASDQDERAHRAAVASGTALNGELALSCERFVACCVTLRIAVGEVARLAFAQVSRERPDALLGASGVWCAFFFSCVRSLSSDPLDVSRPLHRWFFDMDAVLALATVKLEPLQYNLRAAATVNAGLLHGESALLTQLGSALSRTGHGGNASAGATHYLVSGRLLARGDDALLNEVHSAGSRSESRSGSTVGHAELLGTALHRTQASSTRGWSRLQMEIFGRSIVRIRAITEAWSKSGRTNKSDQLVPKIEWGALARKWRSEVDASADMDGGFAASEKDERQILRQGKFVFMQAAMEEQQWPSASAPVMQRPTSSRCAVGNLRSHLGSTHGVGTNMEDGATQPAPAAPSDWGRNMSAPRVAAQLPATPGDSSTERRLERLARSEPMHSMIARHSSAVSGAHSASPPSGLRDVDQLIEATRRFRIQSSLDQPRAQLVPVDDAQAPLRYSQERLIKEQAAGLVRTAPMRAQHITHGASSSGPSSPHDRPRSAYTTTPQSPHYRMRYLEHVRANPHELDPMAYLLGSTFEYKQLYEEHAELADMKLEFGPEVRDIEPHLYDGRLLDGRLLLRGRAKTASSAPDLDRIPPPHATAYEPSELDTQHLHEPRSPELAAAADEALERVHETVSKARETGPAPRPGSHYDRRTWRPVVAVATAAAALPCVPTVGHELEGEYVRHYLYHAASIWTAERSKASLPWRPPPRRPAPPPPQPLPGRLRVSPSSPSIHAASSEAGLGTVQEAGVAHSHPVPRAAVIASASTAMKAFQEQRRTFIRPWYVIAGKLNAPVVTKVEGPFDLTKTIWAPRKEWSDAKDFVDHEDILFQRFSADWRRALPLGLVKMIMCQDGDDGVHQDGDGVPDEVDEVGAVLLMNHEWCTMAFNFFCSATRLGDENLDEMGFEGWNQFAEDAKLVNRQSKHCQPKHVGMIFKEIDAMGRMMARRADAETNRAQEEAQQQAEAQRRRGHSGVVAPRSSPRAGVQTVEDIKGNHGHSAHNARPALSRVQFMVGLVRMAVAKYIMPGDCDDLSEAVQLLFQSCIRPALRHVLVPPDEFRREVAYTPELTAVLCKHESSLRLLFAQLCLLSGHKLLCGLLTWRRFLAAAGLSGTDLSLADGTLCFQWSIMCVVDGQTRGGRLKETCLPFEGWIEALCRVAMLKATPTDAEIADAGMLDGGQYMTLITADPRHGAKLNSLLRERSGVFGKLPQGQPLDRCVEHVLTMIIRRIQNSHPSIPREGIVEQTKKGPSTAARSPPGAMGMADVQLSADEVNLWTIRTGLVDRTEFSTGG